MITLEEVASVPDTRDRGSKCRDGHRFRRFTATHRQAFPTRGSVRRSAHTTPDRGPVGRRFLPGPLGLRQSSALDPRRELHRFLLVEDLRQGRDHHLGGPADRLPVDRAGQARVRAPRLPPRCVVLLVHLLTDPGALPVRARHAAGDVPGGQGAAQGPGAGLGRHGRRPGAGRAGTRRPAARVASSAPSGGRPPRSPRPRTCTRSRRYGPDRVAGFSPIPAMSMVSPRRRRPIHHADRRRDAVVLRLVRRSSGSLAAGVRRPDRRARVRQTGGTPAT